MPLTDDYSDPEVLLRDAIASIAVRAYSRGINIASHIDNRLPNRVAAVEPGLGKFLRRGLLRTVDAGHTGKIALALWSGETGPDGTIQAQVEICRSRTAGETPIDRLEDLWPLPAGAALSKPVGTRSDRTGECLLIAAPLRAAPGTVLVADRLRARFQGKRLLHVRDVLFDRARLRDSMLEAGVDLDFAASFDQALATLRAGAAEGRAADFVVVDGHALGGAAIELARGIRDDPALGATRIVLASAIPGADISAADAALFDALPWAALPGRRLLDVLYDLAEPDAGPKPAGVVRKPGAIPALAGRRILVAEDVGTNQVLLKAILSPTGASVEVVADGAEVVKRHREDPADLIVMDLKMPGAGGISALRQIRELEGATGSVRIVALTAYARSADRQAAMDAGMDAFLAKPVVVAEFFDLLRRMLPERGGGDG